uniref:Uncharacterized protein n=1 Tax=Oryza meridionalis TaxID=40149 RepID=A0A0E0C1H8_9ORYZ
MDIDTSEEATPSPSAGSASILKLNFCCHAPSTQQYGQERKQLSCCAECTSQWNEHSGPVNGLHAK